MIRCSLSHNRFNINFTEEDLFFFENLKSSCVEIFDVKDVGTIVRISSCESGPLGGAVKKDEIVVGWTYTFSVNTVRGIRTLLSGSKIKREDEFGFTDVTLLKNPGNSLELLLPPKELRKKPRYNTRPKGLPGHGLGIRTKKNGTIGEVIAVSELGPVSDTKPLVPDSVLKDIQWKPSDPLLRHIPLPFTPTPNPRNQAILTTSISLREAVEAINCHKQRAGKDLVLSITDQGKLKALIEYGG